MQRTELTFLRFLLFGMTIPYWFWLVRQDLGPIETLISVMGAVAASYPVIWIGKKLLDAKPTEERMQWVTTGVHFGLLFLLGSAIITAVTTEATWRGWIIPLDRRISAVLMAITILVAFTTVINLALRGWGAPFAIALTRRLATDWFYSWTRNPMVFATLAFLASLGLWFQSSLFVLWVVGWLGPVFAYFLHSYEERELEIRLGEPYLRYKAETPFFWPRRPRVP